MIFYNDFQLSLIFNKYHDLTVFEIQHSHVSGKVTSALNVWVPMGRKWLFGVSFRCLGIFLYPIHYYDEAERLDDTHDSSIDHCLAGGSCCTNWAIQRSHSFTLVLTLQVLPHEQTRAPDCKHLGGPLGAELCLRQDNKPCC